MNEKVTKGADPEVVLVNNANGGFVSAIDILRNDKHHPSKLGDGILMYADNALVEFAFPPVESNDEFIETLRKAITRIHGVMSPTHSLLMQAAVTFDSEALSDPRAWEMGCNPNFDAYSNAINEPTGFDSPMRTGSFHLHFGHSLLLPETNKIKLVKLLDIFLGCPSVIFDKDFSATRRRKLYGKAGEYRPTEYGVEYRVLGNFALRNPAMVRLALELADFALDQIMQGTADDVLRAVSPDLVKSAINYGSSVAAQEVIDKSQLPLGLQRRVWCDYKTNYVDMWGIA